MAIIGRLRYRTGLGLPVRHWGGSETIALEDCQKGEQCEMQRTAVSVGNGQLNQMSMSEQCNTLDTMHDQQAILIGGGWS